MSKDLDRMLDEIEPFFDEVGHLRPLDQREELMVLTHLVQGRLGNLRIRSGWLYENNMYPTFPGSRSRLEEMALFRVRRAACGFALLLPLSDIQKLADFTPRDHLPDPLSAHYRDLHVWLGRLGEDLPQLMVVRDPEGFAEALKQPIKGWTGQSLPYQRLDVLIEQERKMYGCCVSFDQIIVPWIVGRATVKAWRQYRSVAEGA